MLPSTLPFRLASRDKLGTQSSKASSEHNESRRLRASTERSEWRRLLGTRNYHSYISVSGKFSAASKQYDHPHLNPLPSRERIRKVPISPPYPITSHLSPFLLLIFSLSAFPRHGERWQACLLAARTTVHCARCLLDPDWRQSSEMVEERKRLMSELETEWDETRHPQDPGRPGVCWWS